MSKPATHTPNWYPASYYQYLKHPSNIIRMVIILVLTVAAAFGPPLLFCIPGSLAVMFFGWQYYNFRSIFPKRTVTRTFGDMLAEVEGEAPVAKLPLVTMHYKLEVEPGRGIVIAGSEGVVVSPNVSVSPELSPRLQQDDYATKAYVEATKNAYDPEYVASRVRDEDIVSAESPIAGVEMHDLSENEIERVTGDSMRVPFTSAYNSILTEADYAAIEAAYLAPMPVVAPVDAASQFIAMSYDGILENGTGGPKSTLGSEVVAKPKFPMNDWRVESTVCGGFKVVQPDTYKELDAYTQRVRESMAVPNRIVNASDEREMVAAALSEEVDEPGWLTNFDRMKHWTWGTTPKQPDEEEGKDITLTPKEFHKAACTPETCVCTSKGFFAAVEATKDEEVVTFPANSPLVKMPSALFSRAVERQLAAGKLKVVGGGAVRAVRNPDVTPSQVRRNLQGIPTINDMLAAKAPERPKLMTGASQRILDEMLKVIPADLLKPDAAPVVAKPKRNVDVVRDKMRYGRWWTLSGLAASTGFPEASVSARMRDLRKPEFGGHTIERKYVSKGLYHYRMTS